MENNKKIVFVFGDYIAKRGITVYNINKYTNIAPLTINRFKKGDIKQIDIRVLETLMNYLECNLEDIIQVESNNEESLI